MNFFGASSMFQTFVTWKWLEARTTHSMRSKGELLGSRTDDFLWALECFRHAKAPGVDVFWFKFRSSSKLFQLLRSTAFYQGRGNRFRWFYVNVSSSCMQIYKKTLKKQPLPWVWVFFASKTTLWKFFVNLEVFFRIQKPKPEIFFSTWILLGFFCHRHLLAPLHRQELRKLQPQTNVILANEKMVTNPWW